MPQEVRFSGRRTVKVTIGDVDLPAFAPTNGYVYIQAPLPPFSKRLARTFRLRARSEVLSTTGRPTLHLVVMGVLFLARQWLSRAWYQIVGSDDPRHLRAGTQVQPKSTKALYAAKYVAKISLCAPVQHVGRFWHRWTKAPTSRVSVAA